MSVENRLRLISTSLIKIPEDRQRKSISEDYLDELVESFLRPAGLLNPIIVRPEKDHYILVIGECRLRAWMKLLDMHEAISKPYQKGIPCRFITDLSGDELFDAEFEENYRRKNLSWQDEAVAFLGHYKRQQIKYDEELIEATKENICDDDWPDDCPWPIAAGSISVSSRIYRRMVMVGRQLLEGDKEVLACDSSRAAGALLDRRIKRVTEIELSTFGEIEEEIDDDEEGVENPDEFDLDVGQLVKPAKKKFLVLNQSFKAFIADAKEVKDKRRPTITIRL